MLVLLGYAIAIGCIFGAYAIHGGNMGVILKAMPTEMMAIAGGALGAFVVNNQPKVLKATLRSLPKLMKGSKYTKARYMETMALLYDILQKARKEGLMAIEGDVEAPHESALFKKYPVVGSDHHVVEFVTDYLRMMVSGSLNAHEIESLMDNGWRPIITRRMPRRRRSSGWPAGCRRSASSRRCSAWSTPWARSASRRRSSAP